MPDDWVMLPRKEEEEEDDWELLDNDYDETLREERTPFYSDLKDPEMERLLIASTMAEVGDQGPEAHKAYIESVMNRSRARNMPLDETITDPNYYPDTTLSRLGRTHEGPRVQQLRRTIMEVVSGSNLSGYATGNESGDVHSGGAPVSYDPKSGERFVQENPDKEWVEQISTRGKKAKEPDDWEIIPASAGKKEPDDWEIIPPGGKLDKPTPNQTRTKTNRNRLSTAIADVEKAGYTVPHFIGTENEPEGDRAPTRDMESLTKALALQEENAIRGGKTTEAAKIRQERAYWEDHIAKYGMTAEQWKKQTGEEDPRYPHEPAGPIEAGNIDLTNRPIVNNPDGSISTVRSMSVNIDGREVLIPTVVSGKVVSDKEAIAHYKKTGEHLGIFSTPEEATAAAQKIHESEATRTAFPAKQSPEGLIDTVETGINAGKEFFLAGKRGLMSAGIGLGETINRYAYSPIIHGLREAIDYVAPDTGLSKFAKYVDDEFYKHTVEIPAQQREQLGKESAKAGTAGEIGHAVGTMAGDFLPIMLTSGLLPELKTGMELVNSLRHGAAAMTVPAMRAGTDAAAEVKKKGGGEAEQFGAWVKATTIMMGIGAVPMSTKSGAATKLGRFAERGAKTVPLASASVEAARLGENLLSSLTGGEQRPFSLEENIKATIPMAILGGVAGRDTRPSKFERTYGFNERHLEKTEWMRKQMETEGIAKATPEKVIEWEAKWKEQEGQWPEEAPRPRPWHERIDEAPPENQARLKKINSEIEYEQGQESIDNLKIQALEAEGKQLVEAPPVTSVKPSRQALGIVADPKATKGFEQAKEEAKNIADFLNKAEHWGPWNSALGNLVAGRQKANDQVKKQAEALKKLAPDAEARKGITMWIEADGNVKKLAGWGANTTHAEGREAYRQAGALKPNEVAVAEKIKQRYQALRMEATARGIDIAEMDNYITHLLARSEVPGTGRKGLSSFFRFAKPRTYDTFFQALKAGEKPKTLDAVDILSVYEITLQNAIKNKMFVDRLKYGQARDGRPILAKSSVKQTPEGKDYSKELNNIPGLERVVVHPDHVKDLGRILGKSKIQEKLEERSRNPFVNIGKGVLRMGLEGQKYAKGTMFSLSLFHQLTEGTHAVGHRINPFKLKTKAIDLSDPKQYDAAKHGVMLRPDKVSQNMFMEGVGSDNYNLVTKVTRKFGGEAGRRVADLVDGYSHYLFESYIPRLKMDTYNHILERNMGRFAKDLKSGKVSTSEVKSLSADQANAAYGHLNYTKMARSPTVQHLMQIALLAPDFFEARARFAAQAGKGAVGLLTGSKTGTEQLIALSLLGIGQYVGARILNQLDHGDAEWDPEHAFQVKTDLGGILPDDRWVGLRSVPEDLHKATTDAGQFFQNRLSPFARLAAENVFKTNWRHEKTDFAQTIRDMLGNIVPLPLQGFTESISRPGKAHSLSTLEMIYKSTGIQIHRVSPINDAFEFADDWLKKNNPEEWARKEASAFPESRYRPLRFAIEDGDEQGAREEAKKLLAQGDIGKKFAQSMLRPFTGSFANDQRLYDSLDKYDKKVFDAALKRRTLVLDRYRAWVGPLPRIETEDTLHEKMRKAKVKDIKERLAQGLVEEET